MAYSAARVRLWLSDPHRLGNSRRPRIQQNDIAAGMKILAQPCDVLAPLFAGSTVATRRLATGGTDKFYSGFASLDVFGKSSCDSAKDEKSKCQQVPSEHVVRLTPAV
jgi:hypothetical protein